MLGNSAAYLISLAGNGKCILYYSGFASGFLLEYEVVDRSGSSPVAPCRDGQLWRWCGRRWRQSDTPLHDIRMCMWLIETQGVGLCS
jgi:hypothetical protein